MEKMLDGESIHYTKNPVVGLMIGLPAVLEILHALAKEVGFFSILANFTHKSGPFFRGN